MSFYPNSLGLGRSCASSYETNDSSEKSTMTTPSSTRLTKTLSSNDSAVTPPSSTRLTKKPSGPKTTRGPPTRNYIDGSLRYDPELKAKMQEASRNVPKYLFRMWHAGSGNDSNLNTVSAVTPHAFARGKGHKSVYDMSRSHFVANTSKHVQGTSLVLSEFSSWSQSPYFVLNYAMWVRGRTETNSAIHIAIIDAEAMADSNPAFNVSTIGKIFDEFRYGLEEEYLVHGIVQGEWYKAVPFERLCEFDLLVHLPSLTTSTCPLNAPGSTRLLPKGRPFKIKELEQLRSIALLYGEKFSFAFAIVLFCCRKHPTLWSTLTTSDLEKIFEILGGREKIPKEWTIYCNLLRDGVYPEGYEVSQQMINIARALYIYVSDPRNNSAPSTVADSDEESIVSRMSSVNVSPAIRIDSGGVSHPPASIQKLLVSNQRSRKRPRSSLMSMRSADAQSGSTICTVPPSRTSSPYALRASHYHKSGMVVASSGVADLYAASRESRSISLDPVNIATACGNSRIVITWCVSKFNYSRLSFYKKLEFWVSAPNSSNETCKGVNFRYSHHTGKQGWYAKIEADFDVKINGQHFKTHSAIFVGPLPPFSIWECKDGVFFLYVGVSAASYQAVSDHDNGDDAAAKRQKRAA